MEYYLVGQLKTDTTNIYAITRGKIVKYQDVQPIDIIINDYMNFTGLTNTKPFIVAKCTFSSTESRFSQQTMNQLLIHERDVSLSLLKLYENVFLDGFIIQGPMLDSDDVVRQYLGDTSYISGKTVRWNISFNPNDAIEY